MALQRITLINSYDIVDGRSESGTGRFLDVSIWTLIYYLAFSLYTIRCFFDYTTFETFLGVPLETFADGIEIIVLVLLATKFLSQRASITGWFSTAVVVAVCFVSWRQAGEGWLFWLALFVVCSEGVDLKALAAIVMVVTSFLFAITVVCAASGVIENVVLTRGSDVRFAMGFGHPNTFGLYLTLICVSFSVMRLGDNPLPDIALIVVAIALNLLVAKSRSSALLLLFQVAFLITFYFVTKKSARRKVCLLCIAIVIGVILLSLYLMVFFDPSIRFEALLNDVFSGRFSLAHGYYEMQPLTLFGSDFSQFPPIYWENGEPKNFVVDNAYCHLILRYGIVPALLFLTGLFLLLVKLAREERWDSLLFGLTLMSIYGIGETLGIRVECNLFLIAIGTELLFKPVSLMRSKGSEPSLRFAANEKRSRILRIQAPTLKDGGLD